MSQSIFSASALEAIEHTLSVAVLSDVLDGLGYRQQVMQVGLTPLIPGGVMAGRARTLLAIDVYDQVPNPYAQEIAFIDGLEEGDVVVASTNHSTRNCLWGELLSTAAVHRGARGAIVDGYVRDSCCIRQMGFRVWAAGMKPVDSAGRGLVVGYDRPIECGGVLVRSGDLIVADDDGVVVIPVDIGETVLQEAPAKAAVEDAIRDALRGGLSLAAAYARFRTL